MAAGDRIAGDAVRAAVSVRLPPERAFELFTGQMNAWWRRGPKFRHAGVHQGLIHIEPRVGGRLFESWGEGDTERVFEVGRVTRWAPPDGLAFTWRNANFAEGQITEVEVGFEAVGDATMVTVIHRGWASVPGDHPARHGLDVTGFQRMLGMWWGDQLQALRLASRPS